MSLRIFISYRRGDSADVTGRIDDNLVTIFGRRNVFKDVDSIPLGRDFRKVISEGVGGCDVLLVVIGPGWLEAADEAGRRRLDGESDYVRIEIETALSRGIPIIPLLIGETPMVRPEQLPETIRDLAYRNGTNVRRDPDFRGDLERVAQAVRSTPRQVPPAVVEGERTWTRRLRLALPASLSRWITPPSHAGQEIGIAPTTELAEAGDRAPSRSRRLKILWSVATATATLIAVLWALVGWALNSGPSKIPMKPDKIAFFDAHDLKEWKSFSKIKISIQTSFVNPLFKELRESGIHQVAPELVEEAIEEATKEKPLTVLTVVKMAKSLDAAVLFIDGEMSISPEGGYVTIEANLKSADGVLVYSDLIKIILSSGDDINKQLSPESEQELMRFRRVVADAVKKAWALPSAP